MAEEQGYKAFHPGMICNGKQYAENTDYEEAGADKCCKAGVMHYCKEPLAVLRYYDIVDEDGNIPEFAEVTPLAEELNNGDKFATKKLHIGAKISLGKLIKAQVDYDMQKTGDASLQAATGDWSRQAATGNASLQAATGNASLQAATGNASLQAATGNASLQAATGDASRQAATGDASLQAATGDWSRQAATGNASLQAATGDASLQAATGDWSCQAATGNWSRQAATGDWSRQAATGDASRQAATGNWSSQKCEGQRCVSTIIGNGGRIKSKLGNWIVLAEWAWVDNKYTPVCVKAAQIDGEKLKPDVWYTLKNGEFVEAKE